MLFLKFGRDDESQSDELGFRYMTRLGYDPQGAVDMFEILERQRDASGGAIPEWQSTHPDPGNRVLAAEQRIASFQIDGRIVRRDEYLQRIDGMMFGEGPRAGFFVEGRFVHPDLRAAISFPGGVGHPERAHLGPRTVSGTGCGHAGHPGRGEHARGSGERLLRPARHRTIGCPQPNGQRTASGAGDVPVTGEQGTLDGQVLFVKRGDLVFPLHGVHNDRRGWVRTL